MRFRELAETFGRLEHTGSRLAAVRLIADLFRRAGPAELEPAVFLLQGQLRPPYEGVELGVGERILLRVIARASEATEVSVLKHLRKLGDLGLVAEALALASAGRPLSIRQAYASLLEVAYARGSGSVERKTRLLTGLLRRASSIEARYLVRIVQGRLRLGVGDTTILEAGAAGAFGDRNRKRALEHAYNIRSDLGSIVRVAYAGGARALARITPKVGTPVRPALAQRLPSAEAIIARLGTVRAEPKYDGFRLQFHRDGSTVSAFSRRLEDVSAMFPELTTALRRQLRPRRAILEGEAVVYNPATGKFLPFQITMTRKRTHRIAEAAVRHPLRLFAFDLLYANGRSCLERPQEERSRRLAGAIRTVRGGAVVVTESLTTRSAGKLQRYFDSLTRRGLEGIVAKRLDAPYRPGARGYDWVKLKRSYQANLRDTVDVVLIGYLAGRGKRAALGVGSLLAAVYNPRQERFRTVAKIGSGLSDRDWRALRRRMDELAVPARPRSVDSAIAPDVWIEPKLVIEVLADEITRSPLHTCGKVGRAAGYALRFPRVIGIRADRVAEDATTEREVIQMYKMQGPAGS